MSRFYRYLLSSLFVLTILFLMGSRGGSKKAHDHSQKKKQEALKYCRKNGLDTNYIILVDMSIHSGKNRLFVWDVRKDSILVQGICCHGSCDGKSAPDKRDTGVTFSNKPGSLCSSIGKYKIGNRSYSQWGINVHYKLHGLENTNNNAFKRVVVLHSYWAVPNEETYPIKAMNSWGCPMVSDENMTKLDSLLKKNKNLLLWIYE